MLRRFAIGCCALCALFPASARESKQDTSLTFVCYNLKNYFVAADFSPSDEGTPPSFEKPVEEIEAVLDVLVPLAPDVLGVMELSGPAALQDLQARLAVRGLELPHSTLVERTDAPSKLALLSRFPIVEDHSQPEVHFEIAGISHAMRRGILDVTLDVPDWGRLRVLGVHLKSKREVPFFDQSTFRAREARELRKHLDGIFDQQTESSPALIVWGDFNETKNEPAIRDVLGPRGANRGLILQDLADTVGDCWTHHWAAADIYSRIDFLMLTQNLHRHVDSSRSGVGRAENWQLASDHRPLFLTLSPPQQ